MSKLSNVKEYAARYLYETQKMSVDDIAKELKVSTASVKATIGIEEVESPIKTTTSKTNNEDFINETSMKGSNNVMIMTESASQRSDKVKEQFRTQQGSNPKYSNVIRKARE